jgi:HKD family nuclease
MNQPPLRALVAQPGEINALTALTHLSATIQYSRLRVAVAYASERGVWRFEEIFSGQAQWPIAQKRFLVSLDHGITQPEALVRLAAFPACEIRIPGAKEVLKSATLSRLAAFHAKCYGFDMKSGKGLRLSAVLIGSNNLTEAGLTVNAELATAWMNRLSEAVPLEQDFNGWWRRVWASSEPFTSSILDTYRQRRQSLRSRLPADVIYEEPSPTELAAATALWIRGGFISGGSINQLELPQGAEAFFGLEPGGPNRAEFSLVDSQHSWSSWIQFWVNGVWRLRLPTKPEDGPTYGQSIIHFQKTESDNIYKFHVARGDSGKAKTWIERSDSLGTRAITLKGSKGRIYGWY